MNIQSGSRRQSWRQARVRSPQAGQAPPGAVRRRQVRATALLLVCLLAAGWLVVYLLTRRDQHTRLATLQTALPTQTSEPEQAFTWSPLRFGSESLAPLLQQRSEEFVVVSLSSDFATAEELQRSLAAQIAALRRDDALILWIRAKGADIGGKAYLLNGDFRLPTTAPEAMQPRGAIPVETIVSAVSQWSGPVLILLDWGNQLCDPRVGMWENQFLARVVECFQAAPANVFCLVSHQAGELSLDALAEHQSLFGRACAEGLVGPRRLPAGVRSQVWQSKQLLLGDLAEYVIRRVWTDSAEQQKPWLIQGQLGWANADLQVWQARTQVPLAVLNADHRPLGWSSPPPAESAQGAVGSPSAGASAAAVPAAGNTAGGASGTPSASAVLEPLSEQVWPTSKLWQQLDQWRGSTTAAGGWSLAALAPLTAKRLASMTLDLEQRWQAGEDFRGEVDGVALRRRIDDLLQEIEQQAQVVQRAAQQGFVGALADQPPRDVPPAAYAEWRQRVAALAAYRQLGLVLGDAVALADNLAKRSEDSSQLRQATGTAIGTLNAFLKAVRPAASDTQQTLQLANAVLLTGQLQMQLQSIEAAVEELVSRTCRNGFSMRPTAELLSRYCWLSHAQRERLLRALAMPYVADPAATTLTMELSLLQAPAPGYRQPHEVIAPQRVELLAAADLGASSGAMVSQLTPEQVVMRLAEVADGLRGPQGMSEATWVVVDGRDLCYREGQWPMQLQMPPVPEVPRPAAAWRVVWANPARGQLEENRLRMNSTSDATNIDLVLSRIGAAADVERVQIRLTGLEGRLGAEGQFKPGVLELDRPQLLRVVDLSANALRVPLELRSISAQQGVPRRVEVQVTAGTHSPPQVGLDCQIPPEMPVNLVVQQWASRNGELKWEDCPRHEALTTLAPFPGRATQFRLLLSNHDVQDHQVTVELYGLPPRTQTHAKGRISQLGTEIPPGLEQLSLSQLRLLARSPAVAVTAGAMGQSVDFRPTSPAASPTDGAAGGAANPPPGGNAAGSGTAADGTNAGDISWGLVAVVRLAADSTRAWRNWIQLQPVAATDFLIARSTVSSDGRSLNLDVGLKDVDGDQRPDWLPTDFTDERPIVLECEIGAGLDPRQVTFPLPRQVLTREKPQQSFVISSPRRIEDEVELQVTVDGSVRALFEFVGVAGRAARREPPDRIRLRSVGVPEGLTYLSGFQTGLGENERYLGSYGALFAAPVEKPLEIVLAAEAESRGRPGTQPEAVELRLEGPNWEQTLTRVMGDRDLTASLANAAETLTISCQLSDWRISYDARNLRDVEALFRGSIGSVRDVPLARLVIDDRGPELARPVRLATIKEGQNAQLVFQVNERTPMGQGTVKLGPEGRELLSEPNGEKLTAADFVPAAGGWQLRPRSLITHELPPGRYDVRVQVSDVLGHESNLGPWLLVIEPKVPVGGAAAGNGGPVKGNIQGLLYFGATKNKPPNEVMVKIKDHPDKSLTSGDGKFQFNGLEAGEYTLEATSVFQGMLYRGEVAIKLLTPEDFRRPVVISLSK